MASADTLTKRQLNRALLARQHLLQRDTGPITRATGTFLVDGHVAGGWRYEAGNVSTEASVALPADARREVEAEAAVLAEFHS